MKTDKPKRIPYGMQNWEAVRLDNCYYVDKTRFIAEIEDSNNFFFFIRPRRFGKSLLMNMLRQYYDLRKADLFDRLFGDLWIGQHPTPMHNKYLVLHLNFSMVSGGIEGCEESLNSHVQIHTDDFCHRYADLLPPETLEELKEKKSARAMIDHINVMARRTGQQIYLFIDEYDHFTNAILADPSTEMAYKMQTHGTGAFRSFFNALKGGSDSAIKRLFITGVSPVTMDDLTSGFNIGTNYTTHPKFNAMVGFTEQEVREQMYGYLMRAYQENDLSIEEWQRRQLMVNMAADGDWLPFFEFIAETLRRFSSQRDKQKGEAYVHGFTLAQTCLTDFYLPISELDADPVRAGTGPAATVEAGGYADIYLQPRLSVYPDIAHSYVLELKHLPGHAIDAEVVRAREQAIFQLTRYADAVAIERTYKPTTLHRLILLWRGMELAVAEEI